MLHADAANPLLHIISPEEASTQHRNTEDGTAETEKRIALPIKAHSVSKHRLRIGVSAAGAAQLAQRPGRAEAGIQLKVDWKSAGIGWKSGSG